MTPRELDRLRRLAEMKKDVELAALAQSSRRLAGLDAQARRLENDLRQARAEAVEGDMAFARRLAAFESWSDRSRAEIEQERERALALKESLRAQAVRALGRADVLAKMKKAAEARVARERAARQNERSA
ncbi:hypothetical protein [Phaeovulum vinaykumarii]|uniref:Flagellar FliJ protein n=1 Tax=Phaeovulum vinaykumarii TaxID=407234 RepID=A0A1N7KV21_9RHOB|nr:hypothetical protein [Phaeovulum vinaykumarii]SIS65435.1 hypothetical protein SAMN05421795_102200 [Phaeovulum vinaykumarii]SOC01277.1 hypothetical protein SAMN05878426_102573 [Phaeovulum vinaykumarii]